MPSPKLAPAIALVTAAPALLGVVLPSPQVSVTVTNLRSTRGQVLACLTVRPQTFPDCGKDPQAILRRVPAARASSIEFGAVPEGRYAIALVHDENGNGRMDTRFMMPAEGYGFSRDAPVRMGPPKFGSAAFDLGRDDVRETIRMRYIF